MAKLASVFRFLKVNELGPRRPFNSAATVSPETATVPSTADNHRKDRPILVYKGIVLMELAVSLLFPTQDKDLAFENGVVYDISELGGDAALQLPRYRDQSVSTIAQSFLDMLTAGRPKIEEFWDVVKRRSMLDVGGEGWFCGPLLDSVGITGRELFLELVRTDADEMSRMDMKTLLAAESEVFSKASAEELSSPFSSTTVYFSYLIDSGVAMKCVFPMDGHSFGHKYLLDYRHINKRRMRTNIITVVGDLAQAKLDAMASAGPALASEPAPRLQ